MTRVTNTGVVLLMQLTLASAVIATEANLDAWRKLYGAGEVAFQSQDYRQAKHQWSLALVEAEVRNPAGQEVLDTLVELTLVSERLGETGAAIEYSIRRVEILRKAESSGAGAGWEGFATRLMLESALDRLAVVLENARRYDDAYTVLQEGARLHGETFAAFPKAKQAETHLRFASHFEKRGDYDAAESELKHALTFLQGESDLSSYADALERYAALLEKIGRKQDAIDNRMRAQTIRAQLAPILEKNRREHVTEVEPEDAAAH